MAEIDKNCPCGGEVELERLANFHELVCQDCGRAVERELIIEEETAVDDQQGEVME